MKPLWRAPKLGREQRLGEDEAHRRRQVARYGQRENSQDRQSLCEISPNLFSYHASSDKRHQTHQQRACADVQQHNTRSYVPTNAGAIIAVAPFGTSPSGADGSVVKARTIHGEIVEKFRPPPASSPHHDKIWQSHYQHGNSKRLPPP